MERDEESGLSYHTARYYSPILGRWISADPTFVEAGVNLWAYARGSPVGFFDETGRQDKQAMERAQQLMAKYPWAVHKKTGWENILPSPSPIRIENMARVGTEPYKKIERAEDTGRAANLVARVSLSIAGGAILGPVLEGAPVLLKVALAVPGAFGAFNAGAGLGEAMTGRTMMNEPLKGWDRVDRGADAAVDLIQLGVAAKADIAKRASAIAKVGRAVVDAIPAPRSPVDLAPARTGGTTGGELRRKVGPKHLVRCRPRTRRPRADNASSTSPSFRHLARASLRQWSRRGPSVTKSLLTLGPAASS